MTSQREPAQDSPPLMSPGGPLHKLAEYLGLAHPSKSRRLVKIGLLILITCGPLVALSASRGHFWGNQVKVPMVRDPDVFGRFLFALPVMELGTLVVVGSIALQMKHLLDSGVIRDVDRARFLKTQAAALRLRDSTVAEALQLIIAFGLPIGLRIGLEYGLGASSWDCLDGRLTPAGWWYNLVSLPVLYAFLLRRIWIFILWAWFLVRISRFELQLTATHPDRAGGLGFVGQGMAGFVFLVLAISAMVSAGLADEIINRGQNLGELKYHVAIFVVVLIVVLYAPLLAFSVQLARCRTKGLLEFGALAWRHDREFEEKWFPSNGKHRSGPILGTPDVQSMSSIAACYEHIDRMWFIPIDVKSFAILVLAAIIPMVPLVGTQVPLDEIFTKLGELLI